MRSAEEDIRQAVLRYCRGVDRLDADLMFSAYHPDALGDAMPIDAVLFRQGWADRRVVD